MTAQQKIVLIGAIAVAAMILVIVTAKRAPVAASPVPATVTPPAPPVADAVAAA